MSVGDEFEVTDPRDCVYTLTDLIGKQSYSLVPNYTSPVDVV